jgi:predicted amidohydrolase YtcJ
MSRFSNHPLPAIDAFRRLFFAVVLIVTSGRSLLAEEQSPPDLVLRNGVVVTVDADQSSAESLAMRGGRIVAVGNDATIKLLIGPQTRVIDLAGRLAVPGFIEGHGHLTGLGEARMSLDLSQARDWEQVVALVAAAARQAPVGRWIIGDGWHQGRWDRPPQPSIEGYPLHDALSRATPDHPVLLKHATGHMCFANARAMQSAGIDRETSDPEGGTILRDKSGNPTGAFRESAQDAIYRANARSQSSRSRAEREIETRRAIELAVDECLAKGVTSFQDAGSSFSTIDLFKQLADERKLKLRLWVMVRGESAERLEELLPAYRLIGYGDNRLTVRAIKRMVDGALGSHGAWLFQPYDDLPGSTGLVVESLDSIREAARLAVKHDYQLCTHAIGDRANHEILELYDVVFRSQSGPKDRRWRIEHAQHVAPADFHRFAELGVIASMQGNHATSDGPFVVARLGRERGATESYAWRSLLDHGAVVINGTDAPVEDVNPILSFHASVTRRMRDGRQFFPEQCMTRMEALRSYTRDAAYAAFEEDVKGTLTVGKLADVVVLSKNVLTIPAEEIPEARVDYTVVGGQVVYERKEQE